MNAVPLIPESAPFTSEQRAWLNGFLAGALSRGVSASSDSGASSPQETKTPLLIAFGSQSGNAESLAKRLAKEATGRGFAARAAGLDSLHAADLEKESNLLVVTSTWGEGEMPDNAVEFWEGLNQNGTSPNLKNLRYSVLALGDLNYGETFCLAGKNLDTRLAELGATRLADRIDCDVEFDEPAAQWSATVFDVLQSSTTPGIPATATTPDVPTISSETPAVEGFTKKNPFPAPLLANIRLNAPDSAKDTRHIAFSLAGSGLSYEVGDALGIYVKNDPAMVDGIIAAHGYDPAAIVPLTDETTAPLRDALITHYDCRKFHGITPAEALSLDKWVEGLRKLQPRLYSIASSLKAHPEEVHLCVGAVRYTVDGVFHQGTASTFLADRLPLGETAGIFFHVAKHFRLPVDPATPVIMVGPGTGIAPFRAFLEERQSVAAPGKNWLFFGDQHARCDFLYRDEIEAMQSSGLLTKLDLAFSRDQEEKLYVQHLMLRSGAELWQWLQEGAHFYVCGDASRMAKDVDTALHEIIQTHGNLSDDDAKAYVAELKKSKRYARDVY